MMPIFRNSFSRLRGQILGWGLALAVLGGFVMLFYDQLVGDSRAQIETLLQSYPPELMALFGGMNDMFSPAGYLHVEFFSYMPLILGIFAVLAGSSLLAGDEENGTLDLILAHPVSRTRLFLGRWLAFLVAAAAILGITYLGFVFITQTTTMDIPFYELSYPFLSLFSLLIFFGGLALLLSLVLPSQRMAAMTTGVILVASYFITAMASVNETVEEIAHFSPLNYYQGGRAVDGMEWAWLVGLAGLGLFFSLLAWVLFQRRDIRVGGEGGWRLGKLSLSNRS